MRTLIDIEQSRIEALDKLSRREKRSRAALIREAVDDYLALRRDAGVRDAFGLWGSRAVDGLVYQERIREEW